jgi:BirA family biotin operon repressor/biotin-[acetyl-CoA-carboxylase] ligase
VPSSPYTDLDRPPLREAALRRALVVPGGLWTDLRVVTETGSTNADVAALAATGAPEGFVLVAERQTAGRGRLGRQWQSPPRAGIAVSVLLRPGAPRAAATVPPSRAGWLPLLAGVALAETARRVAEVDGYLKWPNDLLIRTDGQARKCAGVLAEAVALPGSEERAVVLGIGLNTSLREPELPDPGATSLALADAACADRDPLLRALLRSLATWYGRWRDAGGDAERSGLREAYLFHCGTLGRRVRVELPGGEACNGVAVDIDHDGRLVVEDAHGGLQALAAGDVNHLR